ncbi:hypothetical protein [Thioclava sp. SK-1]|uniref:hypothetical protein n=1 Tax=Thioclava sp. SK-1 TaxID=1889770 RepID=UPI00159F1A21|nr:hypothetical protein [Thioclava sp. SK-1]
MRIILAAGLLGSLGLAGCGVIQTPGRCAPPGRVNENLVIMEPCGQPIYQPEFRDDN